LLKKKDKAFSGKKREIEMEKVEKIIQGLEESKCKEFVGKT